MPSSPRLCSHSSTGGVRRALARRSFLPATTWPRTSSQRVRLWMKTVRPSQYEQSGGSGTHGASVFVGNTSIAGRMAKGPYAAPARGINCPARSASTA